MKYYLLSLFICLSLLTNAQYTVLYENSFRNWAPGQGWIMLDNDTMPNSAGAVTHGFFGGVPVPFYLEIYEYMLGVDQPSGAIDKVMMTPAIILGNNSSVRYYSNYTTGAEISLWVITNQNDTILSGLTDSLGNSKQKGFNIYNLSAYAGDTVRLAFRIKGLITGKAIIDNLLVLDQYSLAWIPDSCFRSYLQSTIPTAFVGDSLNFLDSNVIYRTTISNPNSCMTSLEGLQYFVSLRYLNVPDNHISYIPPDKINFLDSANVENNYLSLFPDAPYCTILRGTNNLIKSFPDLRNDGLGVIHLKNNMVYDCFMCSNRFVDGDLSGNIYTSSEGCYYYTMLWSNTPGPLPIPSCSQNTGYIKGKSYYDMNQNNSYDTTDILLVNQKINYFQGTDLTTFNDGTYSIGVDSGLVSMSLTALPFGFICNTPLYDTIDVGEVIIHDFIVTATSSFSNLSVSLGSSGTTRLTESLTLGMNVKNSGTQVTSGTLKMYMPPGYTLQNLQHGSIVNDTLTWNVSLNPFGQINNMVTIRVDSFPINQITLFTANLFVSGDIDTSNNTSTTGVLIRDSLSITNPPDGYPYDPNNKLVDQPIVSPGFQDYLTYNINFENIGTGNASRVMVRDFISGKLDINSFELLATSHPCIVSYGADSLLQFLFDPIVLTPTITDSLNSKGHIWFKIKPKNPVYLNDTIYNSAGIYFDTQPVVNTSPSMVFVSDTAVHGAAFTSNLTSVCFNTNRNVQFRNQSGDSPISIEWQFPGGTPSTSTQPNPIVNYSAVGDYDVLLIAKYLNNNDTLVKPAYIHVLPVVYPTVLVTGNDSICNGDSVQLSSDISAVSYLWSTGSTASSIYALSTAYYYLTITDTNGCKMLDYQLIRAIGPDPEISGNDTICSGMSTTLQVGTFSSYLWSTGSVSPGITASDSGYYIITVTDAQGCKGYDSLYITINNLHPAISGVSEICAGDTGYLYIGNYSSYLWSTGSTASAITPVLPSIYSVTVTDANGCTGTDSISFSVNNLPNVVISGPDSICDGNQAVLNAGSGFSDYQWSTNDSTEQIIVNNTGSYQVIVIDNNGCSASATHDVSVISVDTSVIINGNTLTSPATTASWQWIYCDSVNINNANTNIYTASQSGSFAVIISQNGCIDTSSCNYVLVTDIDKINDGAFTIYPNPVDQYLYISAPDVSINLSVNIYTATGQLIQIINVVPNTDHIRIDMKGYVSGMYFIEAVSGKDSFRYRVIVSH
ncbi:MAG: T9SS type A sorting domain-containing protein [Bacteroidota bacterium]